MGTFHQPGRGWVGGSALLCGQSAHVVFSGLLISAISRLRLRVAVFSSALLKDTGIPCDPVSRDMLRSLPVGCKVM